MSDRKPAYVFTCNNYTEEDVEKIREALKNQASYGIFGYETAPTTGTPHLQGYVRWKNAKTKSATIKQLGRCHIEVAIADALKNREYCSKGGNFEEFGEIVGQGMRTDLIALKKDIVEGHVTAEDVAIDNPVKYHQYGRTLHKIEDIVLRTKVRDWMTEGIWYWGETGVGKSHKAFEGFHPATHYVYPNDGGWWDGYTGQEVVIFNEFRGEIQFGQMLRLVDKWPEYVRRRAREPAPFLAKTIIVTSALKPTEVYKHVCTEMDSVDQLVRRFKIIQLQ